MTVENRESFEIAPEQIAKYSEILDILDLQEEQANLVGILNEKIKGLNSEELGKETVDALEKIFTELSDKVVKSLVLASDGESEKAEKERRAMKDLIHLSLERRRQKQEGLSETDRMPGHFSFEDMQVERGLLERQNILQGQREELEKLRRERRALPVFRQRQKKRELNLEIRIKQKELDLAKESFERDKGEVSNISLQYSSERDALASKIKSSLSLGQVAELTEKLQFLDQLVDTVETIQQVLFDPKSTDRQRVVSQQCLINLESFLKDEIRSNEKMERLGSSYKELLDTLDIKKKIADLKEGLERVVVEMKSVMIDRKTKVQGIVAEAEIRREDLTTNVEAQELLKLLSEKFLQVKAEYEKVGNIFGTIGRETENFSANLQEEANGISEDDLQRIEGLIYHLSRVDLEQTYLANFDKLVEELDELVANLERKLIVRLRSDRELMSRQEIRRGLPAHEEVRDFERTFREAKEKFGESFFGPDEIEAWFTLENGEKLFEYNASERAKIAKMLQETLNDPQLKALIDRTPREELKNKYQLFLFPDKFKDGTKVTMKSLHEKFQAEMTRRGLGKLLYSFSQADCWYYKSDNKEEFCISDSNPLSWSFLSKGNIEGSQGKDVFEETRFFREYLRANNLATAEELAECSDAKLAELKQLSERDWEEVGRQLMELKINQKYRINSLEIIFMHAVNKSALTRTYARTARRSSGGNLVTAGHCDSRGADVGRWGLLGASPALGVSFSRKYLKT